MQYCGNNRNDSIAIIAVYYFQYRPTLISCTRHLPASVQPNQVWPNLLHIINGEAIEQGQIQGFQRGVHNQRYTCIAFKIRHAHRQFLEDFLHLA